MSRRSPTSWLLAWPTFSRIARKHAFSIFGRTNDPQLWLFARTHNYIFVTKDRDVAELAILRGAPPKIIWLRTGNCKTTVIERLLRANFVAIVRFIEDPGRIVLELFDYVATSPTLHCSFGPKAHALGYIDVAARD